MLNANIPHFYGYVRNEFLYNLEKGHGEFTPALVFGVSSVSSMALGFHVLLETGAVFWRLPIHALCHRPHAEKAALGNLQPWDCFGEKVAVTEFSALKGLRAKTVKGYVDDGEYLFTIDWWDNGYSNAPEQAKCAHVLKLTSGNYGAYPSNYLLWKEKSFTETKDAPDYLANTHAWKCET